MHILSNRQPQFWKERRLAFGKLAPFQTLLGTEAWKSCGLRAERNLGDHLLHPLIFQMRKYRFTELS